MCAFLHAELIDTSKSDIKWHFEKGPVMVENGRKKYVYKDGVYDCTQWEQIRVKDHVGDVLVSYA